MERLYDHILFDLDGTLTDSAPGIFNSFRYALREMGEPEPAMDKLRLCVGPPLYDSFARQFGLTGAANDEVIVQYRVYYEKSGIFENSVYPGVPELLQRLRDAGLPLAVASSKKEASVLRVLDHFDLTRYFDLIAGSVDEVGRRNKNDVVRYALDAFGVRDKSRAVLVGDREHDVFGAKSCGIDSVGVLWGYGSREEFAAAGANHVVETPEALASLLLNI